MTPCLLLDLQISHEEEGRLEGKKERRNEGRKTGRQAGKQAGKQAGRSAGQANISHWHTVYNSSGIFYKAFLFLRCH
jgi:flagellar biosynthesis/type III secretory pathway protein FliH